MCVNIRRIDNITNGERLYPTNDGIGLRFSEWARIVERMSVINENIHKLKFSEALAS